MNLTENWNGFYYVLEIRQDLHEYQNIFFLHQFAEQIDESQSTGGGETSLAPLLLDLFLAQKFWLPSTTIIA
jgi:hypothetical protein